jgi:hypothetical protein
MWLKAAYFYLPTIAIGFALAAMLFDLLNNIAVQPIIFGIIVAMLLIIYWGFRKGIHRE